MLTEMELYSKIEKLELQIASLERQLAYYEELDNEEITAEDIFDTFNYIPGHSVLTKDLDGML